MHTRPIPSTAEPLPVLGLGTWQTFGRATAKLAEVVDLFSAAGGRLIDTSPMYGRAEDTVGELRDRVREPFLATKVWTEGRDAGVQQMEASMRRMRAPRLDLIQVHNLVDWRTHLETLRRWKDEGRVRYIGITHYQTSAFGQLERIMRSEAIDFVQLPMSLELPDAEERLLPLARERRIAVIVNRPFEGGELARRLRGAPLPEWARALGCESWSELLLRWIVSHPDVTCVIPATANPQHEAENVRAGDGRLWDARDRDDVRQRLVSGRRSGRTP